MGLHLDSSLTLSIYEVPPVHQHVTHWCPLLSIPAMLTLVQAPVYFHCSMWEFLGFLCTQTPVQVSTPLLSALQWLPIALRVKTKLLSSAGFFTLCTWCLQLRILLFLSRRRSCAPGDLGLLSFSHTPYLIPLYIPHLQNICRTGPRLSNNR